MLCDFPGWIDNTTCYAFLFNVPSPIETDISYFAQWVNHIVESVRFCIKITWTVHFRKPV